MNSALSLSFQYIIIYLQYVQYVEQQRGINAFGEPTSQAITNWDTTRGTPLGQRGATRDKSLNRLYHNRVSLMIPQCSLTCSVLP